PGERAGRPFRPLQHGPGAGHPGGVGEHLNADRRLRLHASTERAARPASTVRPTDHHTSHTGRTSPTGNARLAPPAHGRLHPWQRMWALWQRPQRNVGVVTTTTIGPRGGWERGPGRRGGRGAGVMAGPGRGWGASGAPAGAEGGRRGSSLALAGAGV